MTIFVLWFALSILVGVFAHVRRNRDGGGWFILALVISPLIAGILVAVLPEKAGRIALAPPVDDRELKPPSPVQRIMAMIAAAVIMVVVAKSTGVF
jgi:hypothetical protein